MSDAGRGPGGLEQFVRERLVHFAVAREEAAQPGGGAIPVGYDVRLFASHAGAPHDLGACPTCAALAAELRQLAEAALRGERTPGDVVEITPDYGELFQSRERPGTDEVALDVRLLRRGESDRPAGEAERALLTQLIARLKGLGATEG